MAMKKMVIFFVIHIFIAKKTFSEKIPIKVSANVISSKRKLVKKIAQDIYESNFINISKEDILILVEYNNKFEVIKLKKNDKKTFRFHCENKDFSIYKIINDKKMKISNYEDLNN